MRQQLSSAAKRDKAARDKAYAMTPERKAKKAHAQREARKNPEQNSSTKNPTPTLKKLLLPPLRNKVVPHLFTFVC